MCSTSIVSTLCKALVFSLSLFHSSFSLGQIGQTTRYELALGSDPGNYEVLAVGIHGLVLNRRLSHATEDRIEIIKLDTAFQENWHGYIPIDSKLMLLTRRVSGSNLFLLFKNQVAKQKNFILYTIHLETGTFQISEVRNIIPFSVIEFQVTDNAAIIGGYFNLVPVVVYFSFHDYRTKVLPGLFNESGELTQIKTYPDNTFDVLISARTQAGIKTIWIKNYDAEGNLIRNIPLQTEPSKHLIFARAIKMTDDTQLVAGVYGQRMSAYSKGIFISRIDPNGLQRIQYYNYGDLGNFFKYMKAKREQRVKERIQRRKIRGKKIRFNYRFMVHEIVAHNDQYVMLGEAFYPEYTSVDRSYGRSFFGPSYYSNSIIRDGRVFDGYRYTHAVVIGFNQAGEVIWDNSFEINDVKTFTLEQFVKLEIDEDKISLLYLYENALRTKVIQKNEVLEGKTIERLKTTTSGVERTITTKLDYWYPDTFFASGTTERFDPGKNLQRIFFINKITGTRRPTASVEEPRE